MKNFSEKDLKDYLNEISDDALYNTYNVYQIEGKGRGLFVEKLEIKYYIRTY